MWKTTINGLIAHKLRLALTALAIVLGVTFISGTLVLTDTLHNVFTSLFTSVYQHVDFEVRGDAIFTTSGAAVRNAIPEQILEVVRKVPGVGYANPSVSGYAQFIAPDGKVISTGGAPSLGVSFDPDQQLSTFHLVDGEDPTTPTEVVMDLGTADKYHFHIGQHVRILLPGPTETFTITGFAKVGSADNLAGATIAAFDLPTAQKLFNLVGQLDTINIVATTGANKASVEHEIARALPRGVQVVTGQTVVAEEASTIDQALSFFSTALLVFAFISLFVGGFTIFNTFSIIVGQRTRELALLRIVGASRRQVFRSVLLEAAIVGLVASLIGLGLGVLAAKGLESLLSGFGVTLPTGPLVFSSRTVLAGLVVGVGVTVLSAISPARRAVRIPPVAAIVPHNAEEDVSSRRRIFIGGICLAGSIVVLSIGLASSVLQLVGIGALGIFVGVGMLAPTIARPISGVIGRPLARLFGISGRLGRENSMRSPRRTAQTSAALMVGLALVSAMAVFGASLSKSATSSVDEAISADLLITSIGTSSMSNSVEPIVTRVHGVSNTLVAYSGQFEFKTSVVSLTGVSTNHLSDSLILNMRSGSALKALNAGDLLIDTTTAKNDNLAVGSKVQVKFARTGSSKMHIGGIYQPNSLLGSYLVGDEFFLSHFASPQPLAILVKTAPGAGNVSKAVTTALKTYPNIQVQTRAEFEKSQTASVNQLLGLVYALLFLAVIIALIGIVNTLLLSVFERTREIGLLRAVGMKRRQVRTMIRSEAVILALFGAIVGIVVGTGLGTALTSSLGSQGISSIVIPFDNMIVFLVIAGLLGLLAATWPARRAARLDVLSAIAAD
jgi:putative ABC transport system permease protein